MKRLMFVGVAALMLTPFVSQAQEWRPLPRPDHWKISANEMAFGGFAAACMLGIAGYLILRKRKVNA